MCLKQLPQTFQGVWFQTWRESVMPRGGFSGGTRGGSGWGGIGCGASLQGLASSPKLTQSGFGADSEINAN